MKKILFLKHFVLALTMMMIASFAMAQAPQGFNYQAFVRGSEGVVASQSVSVRISIVSGSETGNVVYSETHTATTNAGGYFNITIGNGTAQNGTFADIQWGEGPLFLRSEIDPAGGSNYTIVSTQQLLSVPYALHAGNTDMTYLNRRFDSISRAIADNSEALRRSKSDMAKGNDDCYATCGSVESMGQRYDDVITDLQRRIDSLRLEIAAATNEDAAVVETENGALPGSFSVSVTKRVRFSQGNLQYQASSKTWRFALNQYDFVGKDNSVISSTYGGWIDLFAWGTSGWKSGATYYQPYSTTTSNSGYKVGGNGQNDLTGSYNKADWGVYNAISNGGGQAGQWRTLSAEEWDYMLNGRTTQFVAAGTTHNIRYCRATVAGNNGLILFPDNFTLPAGILMPSETGNFADYKLSKAQWNSMEAAGAAFLPAAGYRNVTTVDDAGVIGIYWTSTHYNDYSAYRFYVSRTAVNATTYHNRSRGFSVRLVQEVTAADPCEDKTSTTTDNQTACDTYEWHGNTYTESTSTPTFTTTNIYGCDSTVTLHLTINYASSGIDEQESSSDYTWIDGNTYTESTETPTFTIVGGNAKGCDSTVTLHLTIAAETWVNLGLPSGLLWASRNVGATNPEDYGTYFGWGESYTRDYYYGENQYLFADMQEVAPDDWQEVIIISKYNNNPDKGYVDNKTTLEASDDAAAVNFGGRMPTRIDWVELFDNTTHEWTNINGVNGMRFTSKYNDASIFLPAAGFKVGGVATATGQYGQYWSSSLYLDEPTRAYCMDLGSYGTSYPVNLERANGLSVRAVKPAND